MNEIDKYLEDIEFDENTENNIKSKTIQKAGFKKPSKKNKFKFLMIAAIVSASTLTVFANTEFGQRIAAIFAEDFLFSGKANSIEENSEIVGISSVDQNIKITLDRAYSDKNNTLLLLNFEDKLKRVNDSTRIDFRLNDEPGNPLISTATQSIKTDGGKTYGFLDIVSKLGIENRKSKLTIDKIYLDVEEKQKETGIKISTLSNIFKYIDENFDGEDNSVIWPQSSYVLACKEFEGLYFLDIQIFKNNFLCIQAFNNRTFGDIEREDLDIRLMNKKGEILTADFGMTEFSGSIDSENSLSKYYFKFDDLESIKDYEIVISYTEASNILTGNWSFDFDLNQTYDSYKVELNEVIHTKNGDIKLLSITKSKYSIILEYDESEYKSKNGANIMAEILDNGEPISKFGYYNSYTNRTLIKQFISLSKEPKNGIMSISVGNEQDLLVIKFNEIFKYNNV